MENDLTVYQLSCGDVQRECLAHDVQVTLWREHGTYHVRSHNFSEHRRLRWLAFPTLTEARAEYRRQIRQIKTGILY